MRRLSRSEVLGLIAWRVEPEKTALAEDASKLMKFQKVQGGKLFAEYLPTGNLYEISKRLVQSSLGKEYILAARMLSRKGVAKVGHNKVFKTYLNLAGLSAKAVSVV